MTEPPTPERWRQIEQLLDSALETLPERRANFLDLACAGEADLRAQVEQLLRACEESEDFLRHPAEEFAAPILAILASASHPAAPGARIGPYRILEEAGRGGMAVVYLAERDDGQFRQRVALKLLCAGVIPEDDLLPRFREERQILASLEHPGIARLLDGGVTEDGLPWFAMEYVDGIPIERYCDERRLDAAARLALFCAVCDAVQHAHRKRIVHRDLKPGNILVVEPDGEDEGDGRVKLLDFGIAKLLAAESGAEAGERTRPGLRLLTPEYASPEQLRGEAVTPAADVHALGVLLYRLLSGRRLRGGLDAIVSKATRERPEQRYADAGGLAAEVRRHLRGERVGARRTFFRRGWGVAAAAVLTAVLALSVYLVSARPAATALDPQRVVVAPFENRTGDPSLDVVGSMAADWIIQGLAQTGMVDVVPFSAALSSARFVTDLVSAIDSPARLQALARETGAGVVVSGSYYLQGDTLYVHARITDATTGQVLLALDPVSASSALPLAAVEELRQRVMAGLAPRVNPDMRDLARIIGHTPSYDAYREYVAGMERFNAMDWRGAIERFARAVAIDSSYTLPLVRSASAHAALSDFASVDSIARQLEPYLDQLAEYDRQTIIAAAAWGRGDHATSYRAMARLARLAPNTIPHGQVAWELLKLNRTREALGVLAQLDPHRGELRGWFTYWFRLAEVHHRLGEHHRELEVARTARELFPDDWNATRLEFRALAALGRVTEVLRALDDPLALPGPAHPGFGSLLQETALELHAHGHADAARQLLRRSLDWYLAQAADGQPTPGGQNWLNRPPASSPWWIAEAYYLTGSWVEAEQVLRALAIDRPDDVFVQGRLGLFVQGRLGTLAARRGDQAEAERISAWLEALEQPYLLGEHTYWRARIAALLGRRDDAVALLRAAYYGEGRQFWMHMHTEPDLESLRDYPPFHELLRPKG
jgi:serine/threonine protein kinase/TolB-like protein/tetratricopeptide (TPR) repeat protein